MNEKIEKIKRFYSIGLYTLKHLESLRAKDAISDADFLYITGLDCQSSPDGQNS